MTVPVTLFNLVLFLNDFFAKFYIQQAQESNVVNTDLNNIIAATPLRYNLVDIISLHDYNWTTTLSLHISFIITSYQVGTQ